MRNRKNQGKKSESERARDISSSEHGDTTETTIVAPCYHEICSYCLGWFILLLACKWITGSTWFIVGGSCVPQQADLCTSGTPPPIGSSSFELNRFLWSINHSSLFPVIPWWRIWNRHLTLAVVVDLHYHGLSQSNIEDHIMALHIFLACTHSID